MYLVTIYNNGIRFFSAPVHSLPEDKGNVTISGNGLRVDCDIYNDGDRFDTIYQEITEDEFEQYKKDTDIFTAKRVF